MRGKTFLCLKLKPEFEKVNTDTMMEVAEVEKRSQLLKIHIPILINFLRDEKLGVNSNQFERQVDNFISFLSSLLFKQGRLKMDSQMHFHNKSHMMQKGL